MFQNLQSLFFILLIILIFNLIIFIHELGHFLAAKWKGIKVDRFQIWFGKAIWEKKIGEVYYSLGWIPAGGFVSLPQIEALEHSSPKEGENLEKAKPLDKIIVAGAGPLFSFLFAIFIACFVWVLGKPQTIIPSTQIGFIQKNSPAEKANLKEGDEIIAVNGDLVTSFAGSLDSVKEKIILSEKKTISFLVKRKRIEKPISITSQFKIPENRWFERKGFRQVGISPVIPLKINRIIPNSPAEKANLQINDFILKANGIQILHPAKLNEITTQKGENPFQVTIQRGKKQFQTTITPQKPQEPKNSPAILGITFDTQILTETKLDYPSPIQQIKLSLKTMFITLSKVISPKSSINLSHLSGPVGIAKHQFNLLKSEHNIQWSLWFLVLLNVNLAVLNLLPFPVLDGGHILLSSLEGISGRRIASKFLIGIQSFFGILLISLLLYVTSKDIGDGFRKTKKQAPTIKFSK